VENQLLLRPGLEPYPGFCLRQPLAQGGFSEVWEADTNTGNRLALKFMPCKDSMAVAKEIRAIQAIRNLSHPHLIRIHQVWTMPGYIVVAMELAEGSLADLLEVHLSEDGKPIPAEKVCAYLTQVAEALDFLNARQHRIDGNLVGIQHCDVKPPNMLLFDETVKLADFGLSVQTVSNRQTHLPAGTLSYTAPEMFRSQLSDRMDQYSLAVCYCVLRCGVLPFPEIDEFRASWPLRRPAPDLSMLPIKEQPIIDKALQRVPQNRWTSCGEMMAELTKVVSRHSTSQ
jgi:serine/threonine protein kinase, bacterial